MLCGWGPALLQVCGVGLGSVIASHRFRRPRGLHYACAIPRPNLLALALFVLLSAVWTWPLPRYLATRLPHDAWDPVLNTYLLRWNAEHVPFTPEWWNPPFFFPMRGALALSEHLAGLSVISTPVQLLGGGAVLAYNVCFLASFALSGWFAFLLVRRLTGSAAAALCAGIAYGFAPFRAAQLAHLQVLTSQWFPLLLLAMHAYLEEGRRRWLVVAAAAWLLQGLSNGYYLLFAPVLIGLWLAWFPRWGDFKHGWAGLKACATNEAATYEPRSAGLQACRSLTLAGALLAASVLFVPILLQYREVHTALGLGRRAAEISRFSATPASFINAPPQLAFWEPRDVYAGEAFLFPGVTVVLVIAVAAARSIARGEWRAAVRCRSALLFYAGAALVLASLTLGPGDPAAGLSRWMRPYSWLMLLPGYDALRVPVRFAMLSTLCTAIAAGIAVCTLHRNPKTRALLAAVIAAGLALDGWLEPMPLVPPPGRQLLTGVPPDAAVLEVPADNTLVSVTAMYRALAHGRPLVNGYSGHIPVHFSILYGSMRRGDPSGILELARGRPLAIMVSERNDPGGQFRALIESLPQVVQLGTGSAGATYLVPAQARERVAASGTLLSAVPTTLPRAHVRLDLGRPEVVRTLAFPLRRNYLRLGERFEVEASDDGEAWRTIWLDWTAGRALAGALEDARLVPVRIPLPDVTTRFLRIHPAPGWMLEELKILGP